jgi:hypothetical protein
MTETRRSSSDSRSQFSINASDIKCIAECVVDALKTPLANIHSDVHGLKKLFTELAIERTQTVIINAFKKQRSLLMALSVEVKAFFDNQKGYNQRSGAAIDQLVATGENLVADNKALNDRITELQNSIVDLTPEEKAELVSVAANSKMNTEKMEAFALALKALDEMTPPKAPPQT